MQHSDQMASDLEMVEQLSKNPDCNICWDFKSKVLATEKSNSIEALAFYALKWLLPKETVPTEDEIREMMYKVESDPNIVSFLSVMQDGDQLESYSYETKMATIGGLRIVRDGRTVFVKPEWRAFKCSADTKQ